MLVENIESAERYNLTAREMLAVVNGVLENARMLEGKSKCPVCGQAVNRKTVEQEIKLILAKKEKYAREYGEQVERKRPAVEGAREERRERKVMARKLVDDYIKSHEVEFKKLLRQFKSGIEIVLPVMPSEEKELWNKAIEKYFDASPSRQEAANNIELFQFA